MDLKTANLTMDNLFDEKENAFVGIGPTEAKQKAEEILLEQFIKFADRYPVHVKDAHKLVEKFRRISEAFNYV